MWASLFHVLLAEWQALATFELFPILNQVVGIAISRLGFLLPLYAPLRDCVSLKK